ncbi:MAG: hypothetical protein AAF639_01855 [Chloroflexota bacterium]
MKKQHKKPSASMKKLKKQFRVRTNIHAGVPCEACDLDTLTATQRVACRDLFCP